MLDADADTATSVTVTLAHPSSPFGTRRIDVYYLPSADLSSTTPVDSKTAKDDTTGNTVLSINLNTSAGGFYIVGGASDNLSANTGSLSATGEKPTRRVSSGANGAVHVTGDASGVTVQAPDTITQTFTAAGHMAFVGVSWR